MNRRPDATRTADPTGADPRPSADGAPAHTARAADGTARGTARGTVRVLGGDDEPMIRAGVRAVLATDPGIEVVAEAADGREAVELVLQERQGLGDPDEQDVDPVRRGVARGQQPDRVLVDAVPGEVGEGRAPGQVGVAHLDRAVRRQCGGERPPPPPPDRDRPRPVARPPPGLRQLLAPLVVARLPGPPGVPPAHRGARAPHRAL